jgi:hypothetical protein
MDQAQSRSSWESLLEAGRALGLIAIIDLGGGFIAGVLSFAHTVVQLKDFSLDFAMVIGGVFVGHLYNVIAVPCLWWKDLRKALPLTFGPIALLAGVSAAWMNLGPAVLLTSMVSAVWLIAVAFILPREREIMRAGLCQACGYSLRGNRSGQCPECGASIIRVAPLDGSDRQEKTA